MTAIPTVWCPYCDSANELNSMRCWRCRQRIPSQAERTGIEPITAMQPVLVASMTELAMATAHATAVEPGASRWGVARSAPGLPDRGNESTDWGAAALATVERKQCDYCREWIDPEASVCPYCRTDQGTIAAVQKATWAFLQLFFCFAAVGVAVVMLVRLWQWGLGGGLSQSMGALLGHL